jgi:hypothetical protein
MSSDIQLMVDTRQRLLDAIEEIDRIWHTGQALGMFELLAGSADNMLERWRAEYCTQIMAGGSYCGWPRRGYEDGMTCGHNDGDEQPGFCDSPWSHDGCTHG